MDLFEAMGTMRAMRRLRPDPVARELIERVVEAGTLAPSGGNLQTWAFVAVEAPAVKREIAAHAARWFDEMTAMMGLTAETRDAMLALDDPQARTARALRHLVRHMAEVPVVLLCCVERDYPPYANERGRATGASLGTQHATIYPAVQNVLLACRALGLGSCLTTMQFFFHDELRALVGLPDSMEIAALLPIGWPRGRFGPVTRQPVQRVLHWNRYPAP